MPSHTLIKIEDCGMPVTSSGNLNQHHHHHQQQQHHHHHHQQHQSAIFEHEKSTIQASSTIAHAVQTHDLSPPSLYYQHSGPLIQIAPQHHNIIDTNIDHCRQQMIASPELSTCLTPPPDSINLSVETCLPPECHDANIQTDSPIMSEDENTNGAEDYPLALTCSDNRFGEIKTYTLPSSTTVEIIQTVPEPIIEENEQIPETVTSTEINPTFVQIHVPLNNTSNSCSDMELENDIQKERIDETITSQTAPVDLSGLELLSNSIEAFEKKTFIKQEPFERREIITQRVEEEISPIVMNQINSDFVENPEELGGLNLLCALAEQRFKEEVDQRNSSSPQEEESKKRKHKHSGKNKSSKRSRHDKDKSKERKSRRNNSDEEECDDLQKDFKDTLNIVKAKYKKCSCGKSSEEDDDCCREKCNWPTPNELLNVMESEMRQRLADITRQCQEKKRELDEMIPTVKDRITPFSETSKSSIFGDNPSATTSKFNIFPSQFSSSSSSSNLVEIPKLSSDTDSSKFEDLETNSIEIFSNSKRKVGVPKKHDEITSTETIVAKKPKSLVGYILASKNRMNESNVKGMFYTNDPENKKSKKNKTIFKSESNDETSNLSDSSYKTRPTLKPAVRIKQEIDGVDDDNSKSLDQTSLFGDSEKKVHHKSRHHSKHKKSRSKDRKHRRSSEMKERKKKIDGLCTLTVEHLEHEKTRVITAMGGLFYAGCLSAVQAPDIYSVTLDGERGNRPHIMSREEILRDAVSTFKYYNSYLLTK